MKFINWWVRVNTATVHPKRLKNWYRRHPLWMIGIQISSSAFFIWLLRREQKIEREFEAMTRSLEPQYLSREFAHDRGEECFCAGPLGCHKKLDEEEHGSADLPS